LETHDLAVPISTIPKTREDYFHFTVVPVAEIGKEELEPRLERLYHLNGGNRVAVVVLLSEEPGKGMQLFMDLQIKYVNSASDIKGSPWKWSSEGFFAFMLSDQHSCSLQWGLFRP